jgi:penicillin amidase
MSEFYWMSYRVSQINTRLDTLTSATIEDVRDIQLDNTSRKAQNILPVIIPLIDLSNLTDYEIDWLEKLINWDYVYDFNSIEATFYDTWEHNLESLAWEDEFGPDDKDYIWPYFNKLDELIRYEPDSKWLDIKLTEKVETLAHISYQSFRKTAKELRNRLGKNKNNWEWQNFRGTDIHHLAKIPGLGRLSLPTSGAPDIVNATGITFGPSWRFAIEMADEKTIYGIYPGGQSGYPGSEYYDNMVDDWVEGNYYPIQFPSKPNKVKGIQINWGGSK